MVLSVGSKLGPYEIISLVGAGGMGEVYRANDTRLDRLVAIKILPVHLSSNSELKQRFEREARTISSLSHPHICSLHDIGHQDGIDYLVMEYLEGETLDKRLNKGSLTTELVLRYSTQIADALDKAHRQGIVHRDLKPGNVMLTRSGIKLLDFGLAKYSRQGLPSSENVVGVSELATEQAKNLTAEGTILGTLQYMAPEQLEGKDTDARTDIFAFGAVLYEMITGKHAFNGKSQASLIAAILEKEPDPVSSLQPMTPPVLDHLVGKCLAKDPEDRWQSAHDVASELKWIAEQGSATNLSRPTGLAPQVSSNRLPWAITAAVLLMSILVGIYALFSNHPTQKGEISIFSIAPPSGYSYDPDVCFAISPDGRKLTFVAGDKDGRLSLWLRDFGSSESKKLCSLSNDLFDPFWSSDSRSIGFINELKLKKIEIDGSPPRTICNTWRLLGATWNQNVIVFANREGLYKVDASGGTPTQILRPDKSRREGISYPYFLPDGRHFLYTLQSSVPDDSGIYIGSLDSNERKRVLSEVSRVAYASPGYLIVTEGDALMAEAFDPEKFELKGKAFPVVERGFQDGFFSVSDKGLLGYSNTGFWKRQLLWLDRTGRRISFLGDPGSYLEPYLSPDNRKIVVTRRDMDRNTSDVWQVDASDGGSSRFTFNSSSSLETGTPVWSPDGRNVVYSLGQGPQIDLFLKPSDGSKKEELFFGNQSRKWVDDWSRDGRYIVYFEVMHPSGNYDLWIFPLFGDRKPWPYFQSPFDENHGAISPDGRWMAYTSNETGNSEVYVRTFPDANQGKWQISTSGGDQAQWRRDGKELFYMATNKRLIAVPILSGKNFESGPQTVLFHAPVGYNDQNRDRNQFLASADGQRFLIVSTETAEQPPLINVVLNWPSLLKK
jgi:eukaryotic-like serine/threonine-protein kinase